MRQIFCSRGCGTELTFDNEQVSATGKKIPLDASTGLPHQCPNSDYKPKDSQGARQTQQQQQQRQPSQGNLSIEKILQHQEVFAKELEEFRREINEKLDTVIWGQAKEKEENPEQ